MPWMTHSTSNTRSSPSITSPATSAAPPHSTWKPNLYAQKFIPAWLQNINTVPAIHSLLSPSPPFVNFEDYAKTFLPEPLFQTCPSTLFVKKIQEPKFALDVSPTGPQIPLNELDIRNYYLHFANALIEERRALAQDLKQYHIYQTSLTPEPRHGPYAFKFYVPGLQEYVPPVIPSIFLGDAVIVRGIHVGMHNGYFDGNEYVAYIHSLNRKEEYVILQIPMLSQYLMYNRYPPTSYNVQFYPRNTVETYQMMAADFFANRLSVDDWSRRMLFPEQAHAIKPAHRELGKATFGLPWIDEELNYEQQKSVAAIVSGSYGDLPFLISGPPGTGKTKTVIEAILQLIKSPNVHILACAPSHSAADTIALRLIQHLKPGEMYRINDITRSPAGSEVPPNLKMYTYVTDSYFSFPPWEKLMAAKVVVCDCMGAFELLKARCTNRDIVSVQEFYGKAFNEPPTSWHWTHLFIDEAAQAREPEALVPLMVVAPDGNQEIPLPKVVYAGDSNQLGPMILSATARENGLAVSLFERLLARQIYSGHPLARNNIYRQTTEGTWYRPAFVNLIRNYRSHQGILMMPSAIFYNSTLLAEAPSTSSLTKWTNLPNSQVPVLYYPSHGDEHWIQDTAGWYNPSEINITTNLIKNLINRKNTPDTVVYPHEIAVIAPFREHVIRTRKTLRAQSLAGVDVGTVENYQGGERRITILNCVRATERFLGWDREKGRGIIGERRRFNVAVTRAKELLIIVGNPKILQVSARLPKLIKTDPYWRCYLSFIRRNGLSKEPFTFEDAKSDRIIGSLEKGMRIRDEVLKSTSRYLGDGPGGWDTDLYGDLGMLSVGVVLEEILKDWDGQQDNELEDGTDT